jgi:PAS domain S-box-containing protein
MSKDPPRAPASLLRLLIDSLPAFISYIDSDQRYVLANRTYIDFFGTKFSFVERLHVREVLGDEAYQTTRPHIEAALRGERQSYEYELPHAEGVRYLTVTYVPDWHEGKVRGIFVLGIDITERKRMEQLLLRSERLAAIGETAAMVGHDLRNPLQALMSALSLTKILLDSGKAEDRMEAISLLDSLREQVKYMNKIVADLQNYSGPVTVEPVETDLTNLVKDALSTIKIPENVEIKLIAEIDCLVTADPTIVKRIIVNLVSNAIQAMPNGGKLKVTTIYGGRDFSVAVEDTGVGIAPEDIDRIFAPFFTKKAKGQGLGLAVCKRLAEAHGGKIVVESKLGHGSTFTVTIPMK